MIVRLRRGLLLVAVLALFANSSAARNPPACPTASCVYLPLISLPLPVYVAGTEFFGTKYGNYLQGHGEVAAAIEKPVYDVSIEERVYDLADQTIHVQVTHPVLEATLPGQLNPYDVAMNITMDQIAFINVVITG